MQRTKQLKMIALPISITLIYCIFIPFIQQYVKLYLENNLVNNLMDNSYVVAIRFLLFNLLLFSCSLIGYLMGLAFSLKEDNSEKSSASARLKMVLLKIKNFPALLLVSFFYYILCLPIIGARYNHLFFLNLKLPAIFIDVVYANKELITVLVIGLFLLGLFIAIKLVYVFPLIFLKNFDFSSAIHESLKRPFWITTMIFIKTLFFQLLLVSVSFLLTAIAYHLSYDLFPDNKLLLASVEIFSVGFNRGVIAIAFVWGIYALTNKVGELLGGNTESYSMPKAFSKKLLLAMFSLWVCIFAFAYNSASFEGNASQQEAKVIIHRGLDKNTGVENTIQSLENANQIYHPDFIEIDVQLTSDQQFVVFHDKNLFRLAKRNADIEDLTLEELRLIELSEKGFTTTISTFDDYLAAAKEINQKLLVELKVFDNSKFEAVTQLFIKEYAELLIEEKYEVQSPDLAVVEYLKSFCPQLKVGYVMPFVISYPPDTQADFYNVKCTSMSQAFVAIAKEKQKQIYVWNVNQRSSSIKVKEYGIDAIITGNTQNVQ